MSHQALVSSAPQQIDAFGATSSGVQEQAVMVYVGHICPHIEDNAIQDLLSLCGDINKWMRQNDPISGTWVHFGFVEFKRADAALRAIEFLDGQQLGSKKLVVKVDPKVAEKLASLRISHRFNQQNEEMIRSTVHALLTTINQKWKEEAVARDTQQVIKPAVSHPVPTTARTEDVLPHWYKDSRRETDRLRSIERRKRDRESEFRRALEDWEKGPERRFVEDMEAEAKSAKEALVKKQKLIEQDGVDGFKVRSNFTLADRKKEIEFDLRDKAAEEREIIEKEDRDREEIARLESEIHSIASMTGIVPSRVVAPPPIPPHIPDSVRASIRRIPKNLAEIEIYRIDWDWIVSNNVLDKLQQWLPNRFIRTCKFSPDLASLVSKYFIKTIEVVRQPLVSELVFKISSVLPNGADGVENVCVRAFQLLIFAQQIRE